MIRRYGAIEETLKELKIKNKEHIEMLRTFGELVLDKQGKFIIENTTPIEKPHITLFKFNAKDIKKGDITRFKNLVAKLKVAITENPASLRGTIADLVIIDEKGKWKK